MKDELGLKRGIVKLSEYNPAWERDYFLEEEKIESVLGDKILDIEHIGSTAIPGIKAKPILDFMIGIESLDDWERLVTPLSQAGYEFRRDFRKDQQHVLFVKGPEEKRTHYLKVTELNSDFWREHLLFRDYLIKNPKYRKEYQELKEKLLERHRGDRGSYTEGKKEFVEKIIDLADAN